MWIYIGIFLGSIVTSQHDTREACEGRAVVDGWCPLGWSLERLACGRPGRDRDRLGAALIWAARIPPPRLGILLATPRKRKCPRFRHRGHFLSSV